MTFHKPPETEIAVFTVEGAFALNVRVEADTVWLTLQQISDLFQRDKSVVSRHLRNIFQSLELVKESVVAKNATTASDGKTYQVEFFNLDAILSVGYRVNSKRGTQFRIWANTVLRDHLLKGYSLNQARLQTRGVEDLQSAISLLTSTLSSQAMVTDQGRAILDVVQTYARSWNILLAYDDDTLAEPAKGNKAPKPFPVADAKQAISALKLDLLAKGEATDLFALERGPQLDAIIEGLEQEVFGTTLYPTVESRAAHLLYFIIKDHPLADGNKRVGSFLFVSYLALHGLHRRINDNTLVALALLTAESNPKQKDLVIRLIMNLIA